MAPVGAALWRSLRAHQVYGANTDVGKTIVSTILCNAVRHRNAEEKSAFLKPVSTGPQEEADDRHLKRHAPDSLTRCLYQFNEPVSPHIASQQKPFMVPRDEEILSSVHETLSSWADNGIDFALVETAGGVHSPGPNGKSQADLYRPLRLPIILVADPRLGGISSSISAYESLLIRGYDVESVLLFRDDYYQNHEYLGNYFRNKNIPLVPLPPPPTRPRSQNPESQARDREALDTYYRAVAEETNVISLLGKLWLRNAERIDALDEMASRAQKTIWYPFTQHHGMVAKDITPIDSAFDDFFQTYKSPQTPTQRGKLQATFDGSASWWTQGLGHGNPGLALSAAYAAGRYGHVMFPGNIHEPALALAELLLRIVGNSRLQKVFYTDNGSTGMEVALKMGLRATCDRYGWDASREPINVLGLKGSYHGDTIGVMDCSEPSTYNQRVEWYRGRGYWFDFPLVKMSQGIWQVEFPRTLSEHLGTVEEFSSLDSVFDVEARVNSATGARYKKYLLDTIKQLVHEKGMKFGALIMEPIILGAGGMLFCDPLFQRCLADVVRKNPQLFDTTNPSYAESSPQSGLSWSGLPIIFDEVFTGLYRLGRRSSASFLGVEPDIAVNAKLLTGGLVPLCTTLASQQIFDAFSSPEKRDALLHGHSYTAHAVGCQVAIDSLQTMNRLDENGTWKEFKDDWKQPHADLGLRSSEGPNVWSVWSHEFVRDLSYAASVDGVFAIGTVLSITLKDSQGAGYTSTAAKGLQQRLSVGGSSFNVHSRVLGHVLYLMSSVTSKKETLREIEDLLRKSLL
ncbi:pyridoxal phosphate-dependent transferase [Aspergillus egyptiacus]|nr:pyridoxal phosphate-dependent transferase [Aspergillus egyptiacus]